MRGDSTVYKKRHSTIGRAIFKISMDGTFFAVLKFLPAREIVCLPEGCSIKLVLNENRKSVLVENCNFWAAFTENLFAVLIENCS